MLSTMQPMFIHTYWLIILKRFVVKWIFYKPALRCSLLPKSNMDSFGKLYTNSLQPIINQG